VTAEAGYNVSIVDQNQTILNKSLAGIKGSLVRIAKKKFEKDPKVCHWYAWLTKILSYNGWMEKAGEKYIEDVLNRVKITTSLEEGAKATDLVIEAIVENIDAKHKLFKQLDSLAPRYH
jgi:3-hydroxyacyl-CoA dehydrogenase